MRLIWLIVKALAIPVGIMTVISLLDSGQVAW